MKPLSPLQRTALWLTLTVVTTVEFVRLALLPSFADTWAHHQAIITLSIGSPWRYRVLTEYGSALIAPTPGAYAVVSLIGHLILFALLYRLTAQYLGGVWGWAGAGVIAALMPPMLRHWQGYLWTPLEAVWLLAALLLLERGRPAIGRYALLVLLAALTRETGVLLVAVYAARRWPFLRVNREWAALAFYAGLWLLVYAGLRLVLGDAPHTVGGIAGTLIANLGNLQYAVLQNALFLPLLVAGLLGALHGDGDARRLALVVLAYAGTIALWGQWHEVRLWLPVLPLLLRLTGLSLAPRK
jgi:hypothetical protein